MLGEGALFLIARSANLNLDRNEAFLAEASQQFMGGDHLKTLRAAGVAVAGEHGRRELRDLLIGQGLTALGADGDAAPTEAADVAGDGGDVVHW